MSYPEKWTFTTVASGIHSLPWYLHPFTGDAHPYGSLLDFHTAAWWALRIQVAGQHICPPGPSDWLQGWTSDQLVTRPGNFERAYFAIHLNLSRKKDLPDSSGGQADMGAWVWNLGVPLPVLRGGQVGDEVQRQAGLMGMG